MVGYAQVEISGFCVHVGDLLDSFYDEVPFGVQDFGVLTNVTVPLGKLGAGTAR